MNNFYTDVRIHKSKILYRGYENNKRVQYKTNYEPYIFQPSKVKTDYKTLEGKFVSKKKFKNIFEAFQYINRYKEIPNFELFGLTQFQYLYIYDKFKKDLIFDKKTVSILSIDIEVYADEGFPSIRDAQKEITLITLRKNNKTYTFGCKFYKNENSDVNYYLCKDEQDLLEKFIDKWIELDPDCIIGWNSNGFDIPYLINRIINLLGEERAYDLSPWKIIDVKEVPQKWGGTRQEFTIAGIVSLDYLELYKKFSYKNQESFKLDHIAFVELNRKKLDYSEYGNLNKLHDLNFQKYVDYNILDAKLVDELDEKLGYLNIVFSLTYMFKCNYEDTLKTVRPWDVCIHAYLMDKNIVIPQYKESLSSRDLIGGYNKEPIPDLYNWVTSFDIKSSYPHQMMQYGISPENFVCKKNVDIDTIIEIYLNGGLKKENHEKYKDNETYKNLMFAHNNNYCITANGVCLKKETGFVGELVSNFFNQRSEYESKLDSLKKEYEETKNNSLKNEISKFDAIQQAIKIAINSLYGAIANEYCRWYSIDLAEAITSSGQLSIKWAIVVINRYLNKILKTDNIDYCIASDTDSAYLNLNSIVEKLKIENKKEIIDKLVIFCNDYLQKEISKGFIDLAEIMNAKENKIRMARENIADRALWTAKKRYIMNVVNSKGITYSEPKLKIVGLEPVKSDIPMICRNKIIESIKLIINSDNNTLINYIDKFREEYYNLKFNEIAIPKGVSDIKKFVSQNSKYVKGTPLHCRASILYNELIDKYNLIQKYEKIKEGDKIRYCYLKMPNTLHENVIASFDELPEEFNLESYIDYEKQFEKTFLNPLESICNVISWKLCKEVSLNEFFVY